MVYLDSHILKKSKYKEFIEFCIKKNTHIIISTFEKKTYDSLGEFVPLPKDIDFKDIIISESEWVYCYKIKYYESLSTLTQYDSLIEFFDIADVYRLMFVANNEVTVDCLDEVITVY